MSSNPIIATDPVKAKPGPKPKAQVNVEQLQINVEQLQDRVHNLEQLIVRTCHQQGISHQLITKAGLTPYMPTKGDMSKFKKVG